MSVILPHILTKGAWKVSALSGPSNESTSLLSSSDNGWARLTETHPHEKHSKFLPPGTVSLAQKHHTKTQNPSTEICHACLESIGCGDEQLAKPRERECKLPSICHPSKSWTMWLFATPNTAFAFISHEVRIPALNRLILAVHFLWKSDGGFTFVNYGLTKTNHTLLDETFTFVKYRPTKIQLCFRISAFAKHLLVLTVILQADHFPLVWSSKRYRNDNKTAFLTAKTRLFKSLQIHRKQSIYNPLHLPSALSSPRSPSSLKSYPTTLATKTPSAPRSTAP